MTLKYEKIIEDVRGKIFFYSQNDEFIGITETKKNFARGGYYIEIEQSLFLISGKIKYFEKNIKNNSEKINIYFAPYMITVPPNTAILLIALEESLLVETLPQNQKLKIQYPEYRQIVNEKMKLN